jgi:voltage-gated potassium channel
MFFLHVTALIRKFFIQLTNDTFQNPLRRLQLSLLTLVLLTLSATLVYMVLEGWTPLEALYMTVITIATVGFGEVRPMSPLGRTFTIGLILVGVGVTTAAISTALSLTISPVLWRSVQLRRMKRMIDTLEQHYIVCGYGRIGRQIIRDLQMRDEKFVLIDGSPEMEEQFIEKKLPFIIGDATRDEVLLAAGVDRAKGVVAALNNDSSNVMVVLTARGLNPAIFIVARVVHADSEKKLLRAGANRVVNPYQIGGHRIALSLLRPTVDYFLDKIFHFGTGQDIDIGQLAVYPGSSLAGQTLGECDLRRVYQVNVLAIQQPGGELILTPPPTTYLETGAVLIIIGIPEAIYRLERDNQHQGG